MSATAHERGTMKRLALLGRSVIDQLVAELHETLESLNTVGVR